jgi:hypothetical protein
MQVLIVLQPPIATHDTLATALAQEATRTVLLKSPVLPVQKMSLRASLPPKQIATPIQSVIRFLSRCASCSFIV